MAKGEPKRCPYPITQSDEKVCLRCRLRWDTNEDKPPCPQGGIQDIQFGI